MSTILSSGPTRPIVVHCALVLKLARHVRIEAAGRMRFYPLILGILAVWRVTHLLNAEDGPWEVLAWFRRRLGKSSLGFLFDCFYCLSLWIALPFAFVIANTWTEGILQWLAFSAGAILLERSVPDRTRPAQAEYWEDVEERHGMLRERPGPSDNLYHKNE